MSFPSTLDSTRARFKAGRDRDTVGHAEELSTANTLPGRRRKLTIHDCLIDPCPICVIEGCVKVTTETPWTGATWKLKATVEGLTILRQQGHYAALTPAASPPPRQKRPTLFAALNSISHSRLYAPPNAIDSLPY